MWKKESGRTSLAVEFGGRRAIVPSIFACHFVAKRRPVLVVVHFVGRFASGLSNRSLFSAFDANVFGVAVEALRSRVPLLPRIDGIASGTRRVGIILTGTHLEDVLIQLSSKNPYLDNI